MIPLHMMAANTTILGSHAKPNDTSHYKVTLYISYTVISLIGILLNGVSMYVMTRTRSIRRCSVYVLLLNQSLADTAISLFTLIWILTDTTVPAGNKSGWLDWCYCVFMYPQFLVGFGNFVSSYNLSLISAERCFGVVWPVRHRLHCQRRRLVALAAAMWPLGLVLMLAFALPTNGIQPNGRCYFWSRFPSPTDAKVYAVTLFLGYNGLPIVVMVVSYTLIYARISRRTPALDIKLNVVKMLTTCVIAYVICHSIRAYISLTARFHFSDMRSQIYMIGLILMQMNCTVNPMIYAVQYKDFRLELKRRLRAWVGVTRSATVSVLTNSATVSSRSGDVTNANAKTLTSAVISQR